MWPNKTNILVYFTQWISKNFPYRLRKLYQLVFFDTAKGKSSNLMNIPPFHYPFFYCRGFQLLSSYNLHLHDHFRELHGTTYIKVMNKIKQHRESRFLPGFLAIIYGCKYLIYYHHWSYFYLHDFYDFEFNKRYHFISLALSYPFFNIVDFSNIILYLE